MDIYSQSGQQNRKRRDAEAELLQDDLPSKKFKPRELHSSNHTPPAFWDTLSKVWLTRRALKELDRRNTQNTSNQSPVQPKAKEPRTRSMVREYLSKVKAFARHGGPDLSDLKGYSAPIDPLCPTVTRSYSRKRSAASTSKKTTRGYSLNFEQKFIDGHVYPPDYWHPGGRVPSPPRNLEEVNRILEEPRRSLSPSQFPKEALREFRKANADASKEKGVADLVILITRGNIKVGKCSGRGISFKNLDCLVDGTIAPANPGLFYGARPEELDPRIRNELGRFVMPSTEAGIPLAPNFFLEVMGKDGSARVAYRQACYDGALGARGMQKLQSYRQSEPVYDQNAYTITSTYLYGALNMYTTHITPPAGSGQRPEHHMTQCGGFSLTGSLESCQQGLTAFRNAREWTEKKRDQFISGANKRVRSTGAESPTLESSNGLPDITETHPPEGPGYSKNKLTISPSHPVATSSAIPPGSLRHPGGIADFG